MENFSEAQKAIYAAQSATNTMQPRQVLMRQIPRLVTMLSKMADATESVASPFWAELGALERAAELEFASGDRRADDVVEDDDFVAAMVAAQAALCVMAEAYAIMTGTERNLLQSALESATREARRMGGGVR